MRFLVVLALVVLAATDLWAAAVIESESKEVATEKPAEPKLGVCSPACAIKTLLFNDDDFGKELLKYMVIYSKEEDVDEIIETCKEYNEDDVACEEYFGCIDTELANKNITFLYSHLF